MIKQFTLKLLLSISMALILLELISTAILSSKNYFSNRIPWIWIQDTENQADNKIYSDTLFLGCSVGRQLFSPLKADNYFATNAICLTGTARLLSNRLYASNPNIKEIIFVAVPSGLIGRFERSQTFNNFVKPFFSYKNLQYFDFFLIRKIANKPLALFSIINTVKLLSITNINYEAQYEVDYKRLSDFAVHNLARIKKFANERNIHITLISPPMPLSAKKDKKRWEAIIADIEDKGFEDLFEGYFENIAFLPDSCFIDRYHFRKQYLKENREDIIGLMKQLQ